MPKSMPSVNSYDKPVNPFVFSHHFPNCTFLFFLWPSDLSVSIFLSLFPLSGYSSPTYTLRIPRLPDLIGESLPSRRPHQVFLPDLPWQVHRSHGSDCLPHHGRDRRSASDHMTAFLFLFYSGRCRCWCRRRCMTWFRCPGRHRHSLFIRPITAFCGILFCEPLGSLLYIMIFSTTIILQEPDGLSIAYLLLRT